MASKWKLPVIYVCENNLYGEYTSNRETIAGDILARPRALGILAESVDGQDVQAVNAGGGTFNPAGMPDRTATRASPWDSPDVK